MRKERKLTPKQREVYDAIDMWWKTYGFGPSIDDVMHMTKSVSRGGTVYRMQSLVRKGFCKHEPLEPRSIRPAYLKVWKLD
jgi:hypothetical protein